MMFKKSKNKKFKKDIDLGALPKPEKRKFLSMDLIERMIRVEQKVASTFGEKIPSKKTQYYKSLTSGEKKSFNNYLNKKRNKRFAFIVLTLIILSLPFLLNLNFTGNVIQENTSFPISFIESGVLIFVVLFVAVFLIIFILERTKNKNLERHYDIVEGIVEKHYGGKK